MPRTLSEVIAKRPVNRDAVDERKRLMIASVKASQPVTSQEANVRSLNETSALEGSTDAG